MLMSFFNLVIFTEFTNSPNTCIRNLTKFSAVRLFVHVYSALYMYSCKCAMVKSLGKSQVLTPTRFCRSFYSILWWWTILESKSSKLVVLKLHTASYCDFSLTFSLNLKFLLQLCEKFAYKFNICGTIVSEFYSIP